MKKTLNIILSLLAIHLLYTNSLLLLEFVEKRTVLNEILRVFFAGSYSAITVLILSVYPRRHVYLISGLLDGLSVVLEYFPMPEETKLISTAVYFGLYTSFIVIIAGEITKQNEEKTKKTDIKTTENDTKTKKTDIKTTENEINELLKRRTSIINSLNRLKDVEKRQQKQRELEQINQRLQLLANN